MQKYTEKLTDAKAVEFIDKIGAYFKNLPHLPANIVDILVQIAPILSLIGGVLYIVAGPIVGLLGGLASILSLSPFYMLLTILNAVVMGVIGVLLLLASSKLKERKAEGWILLFWVNMFSIASMVITLLYGYIPNILGYIVGVAIGLYFLFETRSSYK
jgi:hypothetical protein